MVDDSFHFMAPQLVADGFAMKAPGLARGDAMLETVPVSFVRASLNLLNDCATSPVKDLGIPAP
jgi:hypothetical protein